MVIDYKDDFIIINDFMERGGINHSFWMHIKSLVQQETKKH